MMTSTKPSAQESGSVPGRYRPSGPDRLGFFLTAAILSLLVHGVAVLVLVSLHHVPLQAASSEQQGTVELLMVEQKGAQASQAGQPPNAIAPAAATAQPSPAAVPVPPVKAEQEGEPVPAPVPEPTKEERKTPAETATAQPPAPPGQQGPVFSLDGTDSDTNAMVLGGRILPAALDDRFRNRPPPYPNDAAMRGEQGDVLVVIHVSASGVATGADVAHSSGSASLDEAAIEAVKKWHFHPAMKEGQPIPFDMQIQFDFRPF